ncbi:hypothetical protein V6N11_039599 [Hibiscus sabdariffa]|uniref:1-phosphatidylinositol-4-phosphate 5-kinase n=1 Tax=Hibiscus sabdariffa TaxID=183260 RepID=A0ABR2SNY3_9ROSI
MSSLVATTNNVEEERRKSPDAITEKDYGSILTNGDAGHSSEAAGFRVGELLLPNGDSYLGHCSATCQRVKESGYMNGTGTYFGSDKLTYKGRWKLNLKHGLGYQVYPNGDVFEGSWIQGTPEGPGKYIWANGNVYLGNMKGGKMCGKGTLTWTNGDSFEGSWLSGMMHGLGVYTWSDGGCYVGTWTRGLKDGKGSFYPNGTRLPVSQQVYLNGLRKRGLLPDLRKQNHSHIHHAASAVDMGNVKVDGNRISKPNSDKLSEGNLLNLQQSRNRNVSLERRWSLESFIIIPESETETKEVKRPGETIIKGHRSYDLMLSLQLGISSQLNCFGKLEARFFQVRASDFGPRASYWMQFPKAGSQLTPTHQSDDFKWKDYCPMVFRNLREMFKIDAADYMMSICGNDALRELPSPGKSGSIFFLSHDDRFMIKTLREAEVKSSSPAPPAPSTSHFSTPFELTIMNHVLSQFRFVVMGNMFCTELRIHKRFDLKGSSLGRSADKVEIDENTTLKDLDLNYCFYLEPSWREALLRAPQHVRSLVSYNRVDGLGSVAEEEEDEISNYPQGLVLIPHGTDDDSVVVGHHIRGRRLRASAAGDEEIPDPAWWAEQIPGKEENMFHEAYDVVLYLGIIDIFQEYNMTKKIEHAYKSLKFDSLSISAVDPRFYSQRFLDFIRKVFPLNSMKT